MIAYPGYHGLPEWEPCVLILEKKFDFEGMETDIGDVNNLRLEYNSFLVVSCKRLSFMVGW